MLRPCCTKLPTSSNIRTRYSKFRLRTKSSAEKENHKSAAAFSVPMQVEQQDRRSSRLYIAIWPGIAGETLLYNQWVDEEHQPHDKMGETFPPSLNFVLSSSVFHSPSLERDFVGYRSRGLQSGHEQLLDKSNLRTQSPCQMAIVAYCHIVGDSKSFEGA